MPIRMFKSIGAILLERELNYRPLARVEVLEVVAYNAWAIGFALAGWGVWSIATGTVFKALVGSMLMVRASPVRIVRPRPAYDLVRPLLGFGLRFQSIHVVNLLYDGGLIFGTGAIAGLATLGIFSLALRALQVPNLVFESFWRVSYPSMSRLLTIGEDPRPVIERGITLVAIPAGAAFAGIACAGPGLLPAALGEKWAGVGDVLLWATIGQMAAIPVSTLAAGFLFAAGAAGVVLRVAALRTVVGVGVALALLPLLGVSALGLAMGIAALMDAVLLGKACARRTGARLVGPMLVPTLMGLLAIAVGWTVASHGKPELATGIGAIALAEALYFAGLAIFGRAPLADVLSLTRSSLRTAAVRG
jgi:O-antigen/teichoic acid export membrane protein